MTKADQQLIHESYTWVLLCYFLASMNIWNTLWSIPPILFTGWLLYWPTREPDEDK